MPVTDDAAASTALAVLFMDWAVSPGQRLGSKKELSTASISANTDPYHKGQGFPPAPQVMPSSTTASSRDISHHFQVRPR